MWDNTDPSEVGAQRPLASTIDRTLIAILGIGLVAFWCLAALWWIES